MILSIECPLCGEAAEHDFMRCNSQDKYAGFVICPACEQTLSVKAFVYYDIDVKPTNAEATDARPQLPIFGVSCGLDADGSAHVLLKDVVVNSA